MEDKASTRFNVEEVHMPNNGVLFNFADTAATFTYNPYGGQVEFRGALLHTFRVGTAHTLECARKVIRSLCARDRITVWVPPSTLLMDRGHQGHIEALHTPVWTDESRVHVRPGTLRSDRHFCACGTCEMPDSFNYRECPCTPWCTAYYIP